VDSVSYPRPFWWDNHGHFGVTGHGHFGGVTASKNPLAFPVVPSQSCGKILSSQSLRHKKVRLYEASRRANARLQREGASAPPAPTPRKNKNKSCLSKVGSVWLLSLTIESCWLKQKGPRESPRASGPAQGVTYFRTRDGAGNETIRDFARWGCGSASAYRSRTRDTSAGSMSAAAAIRSRGREEP